MKKKVFIIAGEASGDIIGANLIKVIKHSQIELKGIGGDAMKQVGMNLEFHYENIAIMGIFEVISSYFSLLKYLHKTIDIITAYQPDLIITIDSPGFNFRVIDALRKKNLQFKAIHYVAPTVWAYSPERVKNVARLYDHILLILPFESQYFNCMPHTFVGHPIVEDMACMMNQNNVKQINNDEKWNIAILPGSRKVEIKRHMPILHDFMKLFRQTHQDRNIIFNFLTLPHLRNFLIYDMQVKENICSDVINHNNMIQNSVLGIVKSGTITMRFMANMTPCITFYKVHCITAWIMKRKLQIKRFNLCNIITHSDTIPELIQKDFTAQNLVESATNMLLNSNHKILECYKQTWKQLKQNELPSIKAAKIIFQYLGI